MIDVHYFEKSVLVLLIFDFQPMKISKSSTHPFGVFPFLFGILMC